MFEFILRKNNSRKVKKEKKETALSLHDRALLILGNILWYGSLIVYYVTYSVIWFIRKDKEEIQSFRNLLWQYMHLSHILNGNAISKSDFDVIKKKDKRLHYLMKTSQVNGYCYNVCFRILKCLKKGEIHLIAIKWTQKEEASEEHRDKEYTMHALYVNNGWCFDTYGERQYPLEEVMRREQAKFYRSYNFEDIETITFSQFRQKEGPALRKWCEENDCYLQMSED